MSAAKKMRKETAKAFDEYTVAELRDLVQNCVALEKRVATTDEEMRELKINLTQDAVSVDRIKAVIGKQFSAQMLADRDLSEKEKERLRTSGREIQAIVPNVTPSIAMELGLDKVDDKGQPKTKFADSFLTTVPSKLLPSGATLKLMRMMNFKYVKRSCELVVFGRYKWFAKPRPKAMPKASRASVAKAEVGDAKSEAPDGDDGGEDCADEAGEGEGGEADYGVDTGDAEADETEGSPQASGRSAGGSADIEPA
eukprot:CAMPEP_0117529366 /NCGR_PEP_ID=MMETSP0784-20121206/37796_1 /TAXON_ID=39447 /ORGANISM="" /LENGTH=253 /DNA_ID=CAMNT_0005325687 /DNA_START=65 /DNA_END=823 /DNA_ORIENTATION=+